MLRAIAAGLFILVVCGCFSTPHAQTLTLATTTSTRDSGLLDDLLPVFQQQTGIEVKMVAVGSGQALELGRRGDADLLLTHAPEAERQFVEKGYGLDRRTVMYNDFVLLGPASDPAQLKEGRCSIAEAFHRIAQGRHPFVSRGDDSGTHQKEQEIWKLAGQNPQGDWYLRAGSGMAQTLRLASEKQAYTLSDRGTFLVQRQHVELEIVLAGDRTLTNEYAVILVNPAKHPHVGHAAAERFRDFLLSKETQARIADFGRERFGEPIFFPSERGLGARRKRGKGGKIVGGVPG